LKLHNILMTIYFAVIADVRCRDVSEIRDLFASSFNPPGRSRVARKSHTHAARDDMSQREPDSYK
ncbi:MAG TPA: hypothetical protein VFU05_02050, partial [Cyclobacteriaceae bacterium]|nr:hypothetical protein [Cyclobacteriaceae bacterium]